MALPAGFWNASSRIAFWPDDFSGAQANYVSGGNYRRFGIWNFPSCFQAPSSGSQQGDDPGWNTGYFYLVDSSANEYYGDNHDLGGSPPDTWQKRQHKLLKPDCVQGDLNPTEGNMIPRSAGAAYYVTPFVEDRGGPYPTPGGACGCWFLNPGTPGQYDVWHYRPYAWWGNPIAVVCRMLMDAGLDPDRFDQAACDNAYDAYDTATGDDPWDYYSVGDGYVIGLWRVVGDEVFKTVRKGMDATRDYWGVSMNGDFAIWSKTRPTIVDGLTIADGVTSVTWKESTEYLITTWSTSFAHCWRQWGSNGNEPGNALTDFAVAEERNMESHRGGKWTSEDGYPSPVYGEHWLPGSDDVVDYGGSPRMVKRSHLPAYYGYFFNPWIEVIDGWQNEDRVPRKEVVVKQNLLGLNYGPGDQVQNIALTGDGQTFAGRCIEKTIDFRSMTVQSTIIEEEAATGGG